MHILAPKEISQMLFYHPFSLSGSHFLAFYIKATCSSYCM